ncbi:MAG: hypothetical protein AB7O24_13700 [Kofleriaceae bacterium]
MRLPLIAAVLMTGACMADVGGGPPDRPPGDEEPRCNENEAEEYVESIRIASEDDFDLVPKGCWELRGKLTIDGDSVTSLDRLDRLVAVDDLEIKNTGLVSIDTAHPIKVWGSLTMQNNEQLEDVSNLDVLSNELANNIKLSITGNAELTDLDFLDSIERVDQDLTITDNPKLTSAALRSLVKVGGQIRISDNASLKEVELSSLDSIRGGLEIVNNAKLTTVRGMPLRELYGTMSIRNNAALATLGEMSKLSRLDGSVIVDNNDALTAISMFPVDMSWITGSLTITNNAKLTSLGTLAQSLRAIGISGSLIITHNPQLSSCVAKEVDVCVSTGTVTINNNLQVATCPASACQ